LRQPVAQEYSQNAAHHRVAAEHEPHRGRAVPVRNLVVNERLLQRNGGSVHRDCLWRPMGKHVPGKRAHQGLRKEPGNQGKSKVGALLPDGAMAAVYSLSFGDHRTSPTVTITMHRIAMM